MALREGPSGPLKDRPEIPYCASEASRPSLAASLAVMTAGAALYYLTRKRNNANERKTIERHRKLRSKRKFSHFSGMSPYTKARQNFICMWFYEKLTAPPMAAIS